MSQNSIDNNTSNPIEAARKRTRGILHITAGIPGEWEPTDAELSTLHNIFTEALRDPDSEGIPVVATRSGVNVNFVAVDDMEEELPSYFYDVDEVDE